MRSPPVLVVLAAGAGARLGACKALVRLGAGPETTPLELLLDAGAAFAATLVVAGADHAAIAIALAARAARDPRDRSATGAVDLVHNARWAEGRTGSVLCARAASPGRDLCIAPVDVPLVTADTFRALLAAWAAASAPARGWLAPVASDGTAPERPGHPVVIGRELLSAWTPRDADEPLRALRARADPLLHVAVPDPRIHDDLDTPEDLARLRTLAARGPRLGSEQESEL